MAVVELARHHGLSAVALTDTGNLHGAVEFVQAARQAGVKPILGAEVRIDPPPFPLSMGWRGGQGERLLLYVESAQGYHHLCRLLARHAELTANNDDGASVAAQQRCPFRR